jgi:hypothetical protein
MDLAVNVLRSTMPKIADEWEGEHPERAFSAIACILAQAA